MAWHRKDGFSVPLTLAKPARWRGPRERRSRMARAPSESVLERSDKRIEGITIRHARSCEATFDQRGRLPARSVRAGCRSRPTSGVSAHQADPGRRPHGERSEGVAADRPGRASVAGRCALRRRRRRDKLQRRGLLARRTDLSAPAQATPTSRARDPRLRTGAYQPALRPGRLPELLFEVRRSSPIWMIAEVSTRRRTRLHAVARDSTGACPVATSSTRTAPCSPCGRRDRIASPVEAASFAVFDPDTARCGDGDAGPALRRADGARARRPQRRRCLA